LFTKITEKGADLKMLDFIKQIFSTSIVTGLGKLKVQSYYKAIRVQHYKP